MSRSNPCKKKKRFAKRTMLLFGEGLGEEMFLRHLRSLYARDTGVQIKICRGKGGSADGIVIDADKLLGAYDSRVVVFDSLLWVHTSRLAAEVFPQSGNIWIPGQARDDKTGGLIPRGLPRGD